MVKVGVTHCSIGDLVWVRSKKVCGVVLSWNITNDDMLEYEVQYSKRIGWFPEYDIDYTKCLEGGDQRKNM